MLKLENLSDSSSESEDESGNIVQPCKRGFDLHYSERKISKTYSSTSESEDDYNRRCSLQTAHGGTVSDNFKRTYSADDVEEEEEENTAAKKMKCDFKAPTRYKERTYSTDDIEEEEEENTAAKKMKCDFKAPTRYKEIEFSSSESEDRSSVERSIPSSRATQSTAKTTEPPLYNTVAQKMMAKMGYVSGTGLGKYSQGRTEIIETSKQRGRRGLGLHLKGLEPADVKWDFSKEQESVVEDITWIPESVPEPLNIIVLRDWMETGQKKMTIDDETKFVDPDVLRTMLAFKSVFDKLDPEEMRKARTRSNPFETIRGVMFLNRAAMKMANMDACFDFMFTNPKDQNGISMIGPNELLYFADICAGPGGFSEYVLWRKKWEAKGFGFTLKGPNDFKLDEFFSGPPETFEPYYGVKGVEGDGNIYIPENLREFRRFVLENTEGKGVHFVMADGGFSVEGQENLQEVLSKRLYLCQFLCALMILRTGGHFVCKLFDLFTSFSVGLVYLMYRAFDKICIFKPNTSRPANSERYIICKWRRENTKDICDYMFEVNCHLEKLSSVTSEEDIVEVVPFHILKEDKEFFDYIVESNNVIGERQIMHLDKIRAFTQNTDLHEAKQSDFRKQCLAAWQIPDQARSAPSRHEPGVRIKELLKGESLNYLDNVPETLNMKTLSKLRNVFDYKCVVCGETKGDQSQSLYFGLGRSNIYRFDSKSSKWSKIEATLELPADTIFYGEMIPELKGEGKAQRRIMCLHVIDVLYLGGKDVRNFTYEDRMKLASKLAKAVLKPSRSDYTPIKVKKIWALEEITNILNRLVMKSLKGASGLLRLCFDLKDGRHFIPAGLLIFRTISDQWVTAYSKSHQRIYYFNIKNQHSRFECVKEAVANFKSCYTKRMFWKWDREVQLMPNQRGTDDNCVIHGNKFISFVRENVEKLTGHAAGF